MATHSNILGWRIPMDRGASYSPSYHRVKHDWVTKQCTFCLLHNACDLVLLQKLAWRHLKISDATIAHRSWRLLINRSQPQRSGHLGTCPIEAPVPVLLGTSSHCCFYSRFQVTPDETQTFWRDLMLYNSCSWSEPVSSQSCFCWLYKASTSLAAKNIINLILVLTIWWCPCVESSLALLEEGVSYDQCILLAKLC